VFITPRFGTEEKGECESGNDSGLLAVAVTCVCEELADTLLLLVLAVLWLEEAAEMDDVDEEVEMSDETCALLEPTLNEDDKSAEGLDPAPPVLEGDR